MQRFPEMHARSEDVNVKAMEESRADKFAQPRLRLVGDSQERDGVVGGSRI